MAIRPSPPSVGHVLPNEYIDNMTRHHLTLVIRDALEGPKPVPWQDAAIPFSVALTVSIALLTPDAQRLSQGVFGGAVVLLALSIAAAVALFTRWLLSLRHRPKEARQIVDEIIALSEPIERPRQMPLVRGGREPALPQAPGMWWRAASQ